ncbi:MAG: 23S rRNA (adenine(2030)-N(6))-methyltransferase RlmJ [Gammaproteobacteria bacterium]|nr:23S rRNA (adenine(2030)-N(6))-methyltransferase RlmJ [Gammaproteobacteria bacterium]
MNYHHAYHTGHSADIFKHFIIYLLLDRLTKKEKPLSYIETHAAFAYYDLSSALAQSTQAYKTGVELLWQAHPTGKLAEFLSLITKLNQQLGSNTLRFYPGSAWFASQLLRKNDVLQLADLNKEAILDLKHHLPSSFQQHLYHQDGYDMLTHCLPPTPARGLVLIDPPYEQMDEWKKIICACQKAYQRWPHGSYAIWYPIKTREEIKKHKQAFSQLGFKEKLIIEFYPLASDVAQRLNGSGMIILNPPWQFESLLQTELDALLCILKLDEKAKWVKE